MARLKGISKNLSAFLDAISYSEGTAKVGDDGYNCLYGGKLFISYADHPRIVFATKWGNTDAAGRYQFMATVPGKVNTGTWDECKKALSLPDFSPESQDRACIYLIQRRGALDDVNAGRLTIAVQKCAKEWASLPGSPYGQPTHTMDVIASYYAQQGGTVS